MRYTSSLIRERGVERQVEQVNADGGEGEQGVEANISLIRKKTNCFHASTQTSSFPVIIFTS